MGWFSLWSGPAPQKAPDGGSIAPNRTSRDQCYLARDFFFDCLEENNIVDSLKHDKEARSKCGKEIREFEAACSATWVKYFKEKRVMEYKRAKTIERIKKDDAEMQAQAKAKDKGLLG